MKTLTWKDVEAAAKLSYGKGRAPTLKSFAKFINDNAEALNLKAVIYDWSETPSRHLFGNVSHFYKTRYGHKLEVYARNPTAADFSPVKVFSHKTTDPYRRNWEVAQWLVDFKKTHDTILNEIIDIMEKNK